MPGSAKSMRIPAADPGSPAGLTARDHARLTAIMTRLASPFEGERAAAGLLASAFIARHGLAWSSLGGLLGPAPAAGPTSTAFPRVQERRTANPRWRGYDRRRHVQPGLLVSLSL